MNTKRDRTMICRRAQAGSKIRKGAELIRGQDYLRGKGDGRDGKKDEEEDFKKPSTWLPTLAFP